MVRCRSSTELSQALARVLLKHHFPRAQPGGIQRLESLRIFMTFSQAACQHARQKDYNGLEIAGKKAIRSVVATQSCADANRASLTVLTNAG